MDRVDAHDLGHAVRQHLLDQIARLEDATVHVSPELAVAPADVP